MTAEFARAAVGVASRPPADAWLEGVRVRALERVSIDDGMARFDNTSDGLIVAKAAGLPGPDRVAIPHHTRRGSPRVVAAYVLRRLAPRRDGPRPAAVVHTSSPTSFRGEYDGGSLHGNESSTASSTTSSIRSPAGARSSLWCWAVWS